MQVDIYNVEKKKVGTAELPDEIFTAELKEAVLWEQVKAQRASWRSGTHATKTRGSVSGGGIKPYKQKGTGRARQGSIRAPNHVGGGKVFGPQPRDYSYRLPRSARRAALRVALSLRNRNGDLVVLDRLDLQGPKTQQVAGIFNRFGWESALLVDIENNNLRLSTRNLVAGKYLVANALNVYDILNHDKLVITQAALNEVIRKAQLESNTDQSVAA